jgi:hypothetical protein
MILSLIAVASTPVCKTSIGSCLILLLLCVSLSCSGDLIPAPLFPCGNSFFTVPASNISLGSLNMSLTFMSYCHLINLSVTVRGSQLSPSVRFSMSSSLLLLWSLRHCLNESWILQHMSKGRANIILRDFLISVAYSAWEQLWLSHPPFVQARLSCCHLAECCILTFRSICSNAGTPLAN